MTIGKNSLMNETVNRLLTESADISDFEVALDGFVGTHILEIANVNADDVEEIDGFQINDFEPVDYIVIKRDGTAYYVNLKSKKAKFYDSAREAYQDNIEW
jgi:hypothetical protein